MHQCKYTPGVDHMVVTTPEERAVRCLTGRLLGCTSDGSCGCCTGSAYV
jgi:hypothetical protein